MIIEQMMLVRKRFLYYDDTEDLNETEFTHQNIPTDASGAIVFLLLH